MLIYLLIYIPFVLCSYFDFKPGIKLSKKKHILFCYVCIFTLFRGLRWGIGTDWAQFYDVYQHSNWNNIFNFTRDAYSDKVMDYGYMFLNALFHQMGLPYTVFLLATSLVIQLCFYDFSIRHCKYPILTMILLMNVGVPFPVRQTLSMAIALWSFRFVLERKMYLFLLSAFSAALIHKGSLIIIPFYLLTLTEHIKIKWYYYLAFYMSTFFLAAFIGNYIRNIILVITAFSDSISAYSEEYMNMEKTSTADFLGNFNNSLINGFGYTIFFVALLYIREKYYKGCIRYVSHFEMFFFMYALAAIIDNLIRQSIGSGMTEVLGRVSRTFDMFPIIFPLFFVILLKKITNRNWLVVWGLFSIYMLFKFWQQIPGSFYKTLFIPYRSIFDV